MARIMLAVLVAMTVLVACDRAAEPELTTTTTVTTVAPDEPDTETTVAAEEPEEDASTPETTPAGTPVESYQIEVASSVDEGEVLWVSIPAADYTDRDLEDFVLTVTDEREDLYEMHVVDDPAAVAAVRVAEDTRTEEEQALVDAHYLVSLTEGNVVTFQGPFAAAGSFILGS